MAIENNNYVLKTKGISILQDETGIIIKARNGEKITNRNDFLSQTIVSVHGKFYKHDIDYGRRLVKGYLLEKYGSTKDYKYILNFFNSINHEIFKNANYDNIIEHFIERLFGQSPDKRYYNKVKTKFCEQLINCIDEKNNKEALELFKGLTCYKYSLIYANVNKLYSSPLFKKTTLSPKQVALQDKGKVLELLNRIFEDEKEIVLPLIIGAKKIDKNKKIYQNTIFVTSLDTFLYNSFIVNNMKNDGVENKQPQQLYYQYMFINDCIKKFASLYIKRKKFQVGDTIHSKKIKSFIYAQIKNIETNTLLMKSREQSSNKRLLISFDEDFKSSLEIYISYAFFTFEQFIEDDAFTSTNDAFMIKEHNIQYRDICDNNIKNKLLYVLNIKSDTYSNQAHIKTMNYFQKTLYDFRNMNFHYKKAGGTIDAPSFETGNINENIEFVYKEDMNNYYLQNIIRMNSNLLYKVKNDNQIANANTYMKLIDQSLINESKITYGYRAPRFNHIKRYITFYNEQVIVDASQQKALDYHFILYYQHFINSNEFKTFLETDHAVFKKEYIEHVKEEYLIYHNQLSKQFSNQLINELDALESVSYIKFKIRIQEIINKRNTDLYQSKGIRLDEQDKAKKLLLQLNDYERMFVGKHFSAWLSDNKYDEIWYDNDEVIEFNSTDIPAKHESDIQISNSYYCLAKFLDKKHLAMLINDLYRYKLKITLSSKEIDSTISNINNINNINIIINMLMKIKLCKDNVVLSNDIYEKNDIIEEYFTKDFIVKYLSDVNNEDVKKIISRVERLYHYGHLPNSHIQLKAIACVEEPTKEYEQLRLLHKQNSQESEKNNTRKKIQEYQNFCNYKYGKPIMDVYYLMTELQSRFLRTMFLIERDIKALVHQKTIHSITSKVLEDSKYKEDKLKKELSSIKRVDELYSLLNCVSLNPPAKYQGKPGTYLSFLDEYCQPELKDIIKTITSNERHINMAAFIKIRNIISHFTYINGHCQQELTNCNINSTGLFVNNDGCSIVTLIYYMLQYDLKKQKSFLNSIKKIFEKQNYLIDFEIKNYKVVVKYHKIHSKGFELKTKKGEIVPYHNKETVDYINDVLINYTLPK